MSLAQCCLCFLQFCSSSFISSPVFFLLSFAVCCLPVSAFCLFSCSLRLGLPVSDSVFVCEHSPSKDKWENLQQNNSWWVLDPKFRKIRGTFDNQQVLKILFASKITLKLFYSHTHICTHLYNYRKITRENRLFSGGETLAQWEPACSAERLIALIHEMAEDGR